MVHISFFNPLPHIGFVSTEFPIQIPPFRHALSSSQDLRRSHREPKNNSEFNSESEFKTDLRIESSIGNIAQFHWWAGSWDQHIYHGFDIRTRLYLLDWAYHIYFYIHIPDE